ncbi:MAG: hypothetical protein K2X81_26390 [Candidatus Obscuribacterales bacterium]|nr:hypothetical protein [Candidatus Obscuribacterales bacterium]
MSLQKVSPLRRVSSYRIDYWDRRAGWGDLITFQFWYFTGRGNRLFEGQFDEGSKACKLAQRISSDLQQNPNLNWSLPTDLRPESDDETFVPLGKTYEFRLNEQDQIECTVSDLESDNIWWNCRSCFLTRNIDQNIFDQLEYIVETTSPEPDLKRICSSCDADWAAGQHDLQPGCIECGGFAKERSCPHCINSCGQNVIRDVRASNRAKRATWVGGCKSNGFHVNWSPYDDSWLIEAIANKFRSEQPQNHSPDAMWGSRPLHSYSGLLVSVGTNPLPALQVILKLRPPKIALIIQNESEPVIERLIEEIKSEYNPVFFNFSNNRQWLKIERPHDMLYVKSRLEEWWSSFANFVLYYSGGSKSLSGELLFGYRQHAEEFLSNLVF